MTAPAKPWEISGTNRQSGADPTLSSSSEVVYNPSSVVGGPAPALPTRQVRAVPALPPRPRAMRSYAGAYPSSYMGSYGNGYGGYSSSYGNYGGYGGYGGYGAYGGSQFGFPRTNNPESRFIQMAEEGSRPAFQSIESIVQAFCSVSFMMESTFNAMYSSFRAVLGVAENFGQLRSMFGQFLSVFAIFRWLRWLFKKCLYILGLNATNPDLETLFARAEAGAEGPKRPALSWPVIFFLGIVFSGPYLMWKLLNSLNIPSIDPYNVNDWKKSKNPIYAATALYDFAASSDQELSLQCGQRLLIAPKELQPRTHNWLLASKAKKVGLVPANYIQILGRAVFTDKTPELSAQRSATPSQELAQASTTPSQVPAQASATAYQMPAQTSAFSNQMPAQASPFPYQLPHPNQVPPHGVYYQVPPQTVPYVLRPQASAYPYQLPTPGIPYETHTTASPYQIPAQTSAVSNQMQTQTSAITSQMPTQTSAIPYQTPAQMSAYPYQMPAQTSAIPNQLPAQTSATPHQKQNIVPEQPVSSQEVPDVEEEGVPKETVPEPDSDKSNNSE